MRAEPEDVFAAGDEVSIDVVWPNGRVSRMSGKLISIYRGEAYVETSLGNVVGDVESLAPVGR